MLDQLQTNHDGAKAQYDKLASRMEMMDAMRQGLQGLRDLGDMVDQEDVIKVASKLVGKGFGPEALAGILVDMPDNAQGIANWVEQHWETTLQREQQLKQQMDAARTTMGVSALQLLAGHKIAAMQGAQGPANALAPAQGGSQQGSTPNPMMPQQDQQGDQIDGGQ